MYQPKDRAVLLNNLLEQLDAVSTECRRRVRVDIPFTPEALTAEAAKNPHKVRAFLQALVTTRTVEMLVMVWRILQGLTIQQVDMKYREEQEFDLVVILADAVGGEDDPYRSRDINDAALVRHFGITTINGKPLFQGFFSLRNK
jgi:hypothetical protein